MRPAQSSFRITAAAAAFFAVLLALCLAAPSAYAQDIPIISGPEVSGADVSGADVLEEVDPHFQRVSMIPLNVDIPDFYQEVANISGMYIFTMPDGKVYKRIYGALDGDYGWYEPQGYDYKVAPGSPKIDTEEDTEMYMDALEAAGIVPEYTSDYYGILPPEQGTVSVNALFGRPAMLIYIFCGIVTAVLCVMILISSRIGKKSGGR